MSNTHNMFNYAKEYNTANNVVKNPIFIDRDISMGVLKNILSEVKVLNAEIQKMDNREKIAMAFCGIIYECMRGIDISDLHPDISGFYMAYHEEKLKKGL